jgi:hypothetical protein
MAALAGGLAALVLGIIGVVVWWGYFLGLLKGGIPIMLVLGGALAAYLGLEETKDKGVSETFQDTSSDLQDEVYTLKEEIKDLKEQKKQSPGEKKSDTSK